MSSINPGATSQANATQKRIEDLLIALSGQQGPEAHQKAAAEVSSLDAESADFQEIKKQLKEALGDEFVRGIQTPAALVDFAKMFDANARPAAAQSQVDARVDQARAGRAARPSQTIEQAADQIFDQNTELASAAQGKGGAAKAAPGKRPAGEMEMMNAASDLQDLLGTMTAAQKQQLRQAVSKAVPNSQAAMNPSGNLAKDLLEGVGSSGMSEISALLNSNLPIEMLIARVMILLAGQADKDLRDKLKELELAEESERKPKNNKPPAPSSTSPSDAVTDPAADPAAVEQAAEAQQAKDTVETAAEAQKAINEASAQQESPTERAAEEDKDKRDTKKDDVRRASTSNRVSTDNMADATPTDASDNGREAPPVRSRQAVLQEIQYMQSRRTETMQLLTNILQQLHQMAMDIIQKMR